MKKLVYEAVYDEIKRRIEHHVWEPGQRIPTLEELSVELKVGISSVREAVRILSKQKILLVEQGRGTFVNDRIPETPDEYLAVLEHSSWMQLTEARLVVEPELAAMAANKATDEEAREIEALAETMQKKIRAGQPFLKEDIAFHQRIAEASKNEVLLHMIRMVGDLLLDSRRQTMRIPGMDEKASAFHLLIAKAIQQRKPQQARELMRLHMLDMMGELQDKCDNSEL
jgi:GntR family transcriptional repressor for pyruvate dehydrogenase complex